MYKITLTCTTIKMTIHIIIIKRSRDSLMISSTTSQTAGQRFELGIYVRNLLLDFRWKIIKITSTQQYHIICEAPNPPCERRPVPVRRTWIAWVMNKKHIQRTTCLWQIYKGLWRTEFSYACHKLTNPRNASLSSIFITLSAECLTWSNYDIQLDSFK